MEAATDRTDRDKLTGGSRSFAKLSLNPSSRPWLALPAGCLDHSEITRVCPWQVGAPGAPPGPEPPPGGGGGEDWLASARNGLLGCALNVLIEGPGVITHGAVGPCSTPSLSKVRGC
jgi:hypothetical protein